MATLIGDYCEQSRFYDMISPSSLQHQHSHPSHSSSHHGSHGHNHGGKSSQTSSRYRSESRSRDAPSLRPPPNTPQDLSPYSSSAEAPSSSSSGSRSSRDGRHSTTQAHTRQDQVQTPKHWDATRSSPSNIGSEGRVKQQQEEHQEQQQLSGGASQFPSPPSSSSTSLSSGSSRHAQHALHAPPPTPSSYMAHSSSAHDSEKFVSSAATTSAATSGSSLATVIAPTQPSSGASTIPSPESDGDSRWSSSVSDARNIAIAPPSSPQTQTTIHVRDLAHIQSLARADLLTGNGPGILNDPPLQAMKYEISGMPIGDIIEMVAALLTKITHTNDLQHDALNRNATHLKQVQAANSVDGNGASGEGAYMSPLSSSVLAFHGKNVPAITILSYLSRIHKYCPTTYEVFLSLLVYFDRMTERVNEMVTKSEEARRQSLQPHRQEQVAAPPPQAGGRPYADQDTAMPDADSGDDSDEMDSDLADDDDEEDRYVDERGATSGQEKRGSASAGVATSRTASAMAPRDGSAGGAVRANVPPATSAAAAQATYFVVDSFNIHRLIIAGVTCASKFFSDVFYTNSRYAKVGGLPLAELNHLELQFLLLNDFRLAVPVEDLEAYATMLVEFYAREVVAQRSRPVASME